MKSLFLLLSLLFMTACATTTAVKEMERPNGPFEQILVAYDTVQTTRELAAFALSSKQISLEKAKEIDEATEAYSVKLDAIWEAYKTVNGDVTVCKVKLNLEGQTVEYPCADATDKIIFILQTYQTFGGK